jgi:hypothetical protein
MAKKGKGRVKSMGDVKIPPLTYPGGKPRVKKEGELNTVDYEDTPNTSRIRK